MENEPYLQRVPRLIKPSDNALVAQLIRTVMPEFGCVGPGFSIEDPEVDAMFEAYQMPRAAFYVVDNELPSHDAVAEVAAEFSLAETILALVGEQASSGNAQPAFAKTLLAVAGYAPLSGGALDTCELRKMYSVPAARGLGVGQNLLDACLDGARRDGFRIIYLETVAAMSQAARLYQRNGFRYIDGPLGGTGHSGCDRFMLREL